MAPEVLPTATATSAASSESEGSTNNSSNVVTKFRIAVGSKNPCKINAVREAIQIVLKRTNNNVGIIKLDVQGYSSPSGVPDQPFGDVSYAGALGNSAVRVDFFADLFDFGFQPSLLPFQNNIG